MMNTVIEVLSSNVQTIAPLIVGVPIMSSLGYLPKLGPGRALFLALRSRIRGSRLETIRTKELEHLRLKKNTLRPSQYLIVTGPKGVGKSILLDTLFSYTSGVVLITVAPGKDLESIVHSTLLEIIGPHPSFFSPWASVRRVTRWYRYLQYLPHLMLSATVVTAAIGCYSVSFGSNETYWFGLAGVSLVATLLFKKLSPGTTPTVLLRTHERNTGDKYAQIAGAVRELRDLWNVNVIVDGSPNSLDDSLFSTNREEVYYVEPLSREEVMKLPQFDCLPSEVKNNAAFCDIIWEVLGGIPAKYDHLLSFSETFEDRHQGIQQALLGELIKSCKTVGEAKNNYPDMTEIIGLLKFENSKVIPISASLLRKRNLKRPLIDKVFRASKDNRYLFPATNAISLVLQFKLEDISTWEELKSLLKKDSMTSKDDKEQNKEIDKKVPEKVETNDDKKQNVEVGKGTEENNDLGTELNKDLEKIEEQNVTEENVKEKGI